MQVKGNNGFTLIYLGLQEKFGQSFIKSQTFIIIWYAHEEVKLSDLGIL